MGNLKSSKDKGAVKAAPKTTPKLAKATKKGGK